LNLSIDANPYQDQLKSRLGKLWNYEKIGSPFKEGNQSELGLIHIPLALFF
jgi:hypothetical protein